MNFLDALRMAFFFNVIRKEVSADARVVYERIAINWVDADSECNTLIR